MLEEHVRPPLYVVGHRNPDMDSICAAISYATLLRLRGDEDAVAARQGPLRRETAYVLNRFGVASPILLTDVRPTVADVMTAPAVTVHEDDPLYSVGRLLQQANLRALPVVNKAGTLRGLITVEDFAKLFFDRLDPARVDYLPLDLQNVTKALDGEVIVAANHPRIKDKIMVGAMAVDSMLERIEPDILLVVGDRENVQRAAIELGVAVIVVTGTHPVSLAVRALARERQVTVITSRHHTYATVSLITMSVPVRSIMRPNPLTCGPDDLIDDLRENLRRERSLVVINAASEVMGMVSRTDLIKPTRRRVVLVDHNERGQSVTGLEHAEIVGVIDHHRVSDFQTTVPPFMRIEPLGSSNTIIAKLYRDYGVPIPPAMAGLMLSGILADTLVFRSPTTTDEDRQIAQTLATIAGVDAAELGNQIIAHASDVSDRTATQILMADFKDFMLDGLRFGIGAVETADAPSVLQRTDELRMGMQELRNTGYASVLLAVMDIAQETTYVLVCGAEQEVADAFGVALDERATLKLAGIYSRKKQIVPLLSLIRNALAAR